VQDVHFQHTAVCASSVLSLALPIGPKPNAAAAATRADFSYRLAGSSIPYFSKRM